MLKLKTYSEKQTASSINNVEIINSQKRFESDRALRDFSSCSEGTPKVVLGSSCTGLDERTTSSPEGCVGSGKGLEPLMTPTSSLEIVPVLENDSSSSS